MKRVILGTVTVLRDVPPAGIAEVPAPVAQVLWGWARFGDPEKGMTDMDIFARRLELTRKLKAAETGSAPHVDLEDAEYVMLKKSCEAMLSRMGIADQGNYDCIMRVHDAKAPPKLEPEGE